MEEGGASAVVSNNPLTEWACFEKERMKELKIHNKKSDVFLTNILLHLFVTLFRLRTK